MSTLMKCETLTYPKEFDLSNLTLSPRRETRYFSIGHGESHGQNASGREPHAVSLTGRRTVLQPEEGAKYRAG